MIDIVYVASPGPESSKLCLLPVPANIVMYVINSE